MTSTAHPHPGSQTATDAPSRGESTRTPPPVAIRSLESADVAFVFSSWLRSYRQSAFARPILTRVYFDQHHALIEALLARPGCSVVVATPVDQPGVIVGWAAIEGNSGIPGATPAPVLHYVYVKEAFRRMGIAAALCAGLPAAFRFTHRTPIVEQPLRSRPGAVFDPYAAQGGR